MNIENMEISDCESEGEDGDFLNKQPWDSFPDDNEYKIKNIETNDSLLDDHEYRIKKKETKENHAKNKKKDIDMINISSDDEQEDLQSAIMASLRSLAREYDVKQKSIVTPCTLTPITYSTLGGTYEKGSSSSPQTCVLCRDMVCPPNMLLIINPCHHHVCDGCLSRYIGEKVNEDVRQVACPGPKCSQVFNRYFIEQILPTEVKHRWVLAVHEGSVLRNTLRFRCPLEGCRRIVVNDERNFQIKACTCCWRLYCFVCGAVWHMGMTCLQFEKREEEAKRRMMMIKTQREEEIRLRKEEEENRKSKQQITEMEGRVINSGYASILLPILNLEMEGQVINSGHGSILLQVLNLLSSNPESED